jgi:hypothetical protein
MEKFVISEEEKRRILNMHQSKYTKNLLKENVTVSKGTQLDSGKTVLSIGKPTQAGNPPTISVFIQTEADGKGENFVCALHDRGTYKLTPGGSVLTKEESQSLYDQFCKSK